MTTLFASTTPAPDVHIAWREVQRFWNNTLVTGALGVVAAVTAFALSRSGVPAEALWTAGPAAVGVIALVAWMGLVTEVRDSGVRVRLWPFFWRTIPWTDIVEAEARRYRPIREYGGWGLRFGPGGQAWNAYGTYGVQLVLRDGRRVLIGSQEPEELARQVRAHLGR